MVLDPYQTLGLTHVAPQGDIKRAYRQLAMRLHPDRLTRMKASPEDIQVATAKFAAVTSAYSLLSDEKRKQQYDHIYKYGGFDDLPEKIAPPTRTGYDKPSPSSNNKQRRKTQMGIGYAISDPFSYILSQGKTRSTAVAGVSIPSRFHLAHSPDGGVRVSLSSGQLKESPSGTMQFTSKTTQFAQGKRFSKVETTTLHQDGRKEIVIEGDDYIERRFSAAPKRKRHTSRDDDDLTHTGDDLPWYMTAWNGIRENLCTNPCGAISAQ
jgi:curved DNA-binding protein CbpA